MRKNREFVSGDQFATDCLHTVLSNDELPDGPDEIEDEEAQLIESYTPRFAYGC